MISIVRKFFLMCAFNTVQLNFAMQNNEPKKIDRLLMKAEELKISDDAKLIKHTINECREVFQNIETSKQDGEKVFLACAALLKRLQQLNGVPERIPQIY